ncbi:unnamed protein product [Plasmodium vivax]|uniref:(malaria parasite P. vivax) hypothetical protein n=1 Tax=Plasmodium vivax TaxID=5855 RepID=A0A8S4HHD6_PLAVI|nr:unnamed protein product [Plasmodium vivax]
MNHKTTLHFFNKIVAFIILSWTCPYKNDEHALSKALENGNKVNISLVMRTHRLLAKHEYQNEISSSELKNKVSYNRDYYKLEKGKGNNNTFEQLKQGRSNNVDNYLKSYKKRYSKKRGLKKLDCYYENKLFNKFLHLYDIAQKIKNEKKRSKYFFFKKYDIVLFLLSLLPVIGLIHPILFGLSHKYPGILGACEESHIETNCNAHKLGTQEYYGLMNCPKKWMYDYRGSIDYTGLAYMIVSLIIVSVVLFVVIYILLKLIKYQRLKSGRGKMNINQYYHLCKGIF